MGAVVGVTAQASDADASNNTVTYILVDAEGNAYSAGEFAIDASTGVVTVAGGIDREEGSSRTIYVKATSIDGSSETSSFVVNVTDVNESDLTAPVDDDAAYLRAAEDLAGQPARIAQAGARARAQVAQLDWQQIALQVEALFLQTLGTPASPVVAARRPT